MASPSKTTRLKDMLSVNEYAELRRHNLEDNKAILEKLMLDFKGHFPGTPKKNATKGSVKRLREKKEDGSFIRRNPGRNARFQSTRFDLPRTRSRSGSVSSVSSSASSTPMSTPDKIVVRFGFFHKPEKRLDGDFIDDSDCLDLPSPARRYRTQRDQRTVDDITEEDLDAVATVVRNKRYDSTHGTSCHQCRQKTDDMKTICRSDHCFGVRGQFCGPCLRNRYGEDAKEALKNPNWECPPCRGICNCSFCRNKAGKGCTGILIHLARDRGYPDVHSYLKGLSKRS